MQEPLFITTRAGIKMPRILYGTAWKKEHTEEWVIQAIRCGFRGIDTACQPKHYNEPQVGEALQRAREHGIPRDALFVQTKFTPLDGQDPERLPYQPDAALSEQVDQSFQTSLDNLKTDYVDSLLLHSPLTPYENLLTVWRALEKIQREGCAHQIGISNFYDLVLLKRLYTDAHIKPAVVQNRFYATTGYDVALRQWCADRDIIYQSFWTLTANPHLLNHPTLFRIARQHRCTEAQVFFRFLSQIGIVPLTGTCSLEHMQDDLGCFSFTLESDEIRCLKQLLYNAQG